MSTMLHHAKFLAAGIFFSVAIAIAGQGAAQEAPKPAAPEPAAKPADDPAAVEPSVAARLAIEQGAVADKYAKLEALLSRMAEIEAVTNPHRAALLKQALKQSKDNLTALKLNAASKMLGQERLKQALDNQQDAGKDIQALLELLLSENRADRLKSEQDRIKEYIKEVERLIRLQKSAQGQTEGGGNAEQIAKDQGKIADRADALAKKIQENEEGGKPGEGENGEAKPSSEPKPGDGQSKDGEGKPGEGKPGEGKPGEGKPGEGKPGEGKPGEGKPGEGKPGEGKPGEGKPGEGKPESKPGESKPESKPGEGKPEGKPGEGKPGEGNPGKGKPGEGKPAEGKPGEGKPSQGKPSPGQGKPSDGEGGGDSPPPPDQPQPQDDNPARKRIEAAEERMRKAKQRLEEAKRKDAVDEQEKAKEELELAKAELERILRQLREEEIERMLAMLEGRFRKMLEIQLRIYEDTIRLDKVPAEERDVKVPIPASKLAFDERKLVLEADKALNLLLEEGSSIAFPETVSQMRDDMDQVAGRLDGANVGKITQGIEEDIIKALEELIEALQKAQKEMEEGKPPPPGQPGPPQDQPLVDKIAELKMIRALQMRVNTRTKSYSRLLDDADDPAGQATDKDLQDALAKLAERQERIYKITRDVVLGKNH